MLEGGEAPLALPAPGGAGAGGAAAGGAGGGLAPRVEVVNGEIRVVEASLMVQAQPAAEARVVVEDAQARGPGIGHGAYPAPPAAVAACRPQRAPPGARRHLCRGLRCAHTAVRTLAGRRGSRPWPLAHGGPKP